MRWTSARDILERIGGPYAVTLRGLLLIAIPSLVPTAVYDRAVYGGSIAGWTLVGLAGTAVGGVVYLALGAVLLPQKPRPSRPVIALTVFLVAGVVRGSTIALVSVGTGLATDYQWAFRISGGAALGVCWFSLVAIVIDAWSRHQEVLADLRRRQITAMALRANAEERLLQTRDRIRNTLLSQMSTIVALLSALIAKGGDPAAVRRVAGVMHTTVAEVVRPLSHSLAESIPTPRVAAPPEPLRGRATRWLRAISAEALTIDPFHPVLTTVVIVPSAIPAGVRTFGAIAGVVGAGVVGLVAFAILYAARRWHLGRRVAVRRWSWLPAAVVYAAVGLSCAAVPVAASLLFGMGAQVGWSQGGQTLFLLTPLAALGAAVVAAEDRRRTLAEREREASVAQAEWASHRAQQEAWAASHMLARELHGGVQSELTAAALRLEAWARRPDPAAMAEVLSQVTHAVDRVNQLAVEEFRTSKIDPVLAISAIVAVWSGLVHIDLDIDSGAEDHLSVDAAASETVIEVVRECLANAVTHGRASTVTIQVRQLRPGALEVTIDDDGRGLTAQAPVGLGSRLLDEVCLSWERTASPGSRGTRVSAQVTVAPEEQTGMGTGGIMSA